MAGTAITVLKELEERRRKQGASPFLQFCEELLRIQADAQQRIHPPQSLPSAQVVAQRVEQGKPALAFDDLDLDWTVVRDTFVKAASLFARHPPLAGKIPDGITEPSLAPSIVKDAARAWFEDSKLPAAVTGGGDEAVVSETVHAAVKPSLETYSEALLGYVDQEKWRRRYCPICGGHADLAFLNKENGSRYLLCHRCDARWLFQRLECPFCGTQDQSALAYFTDDSGLYRLYVCDKCRSYIKAVDLRYTGLEVLLPLERVMTLDLDRQALDKGYKPGRLATS